jgi:HPt (histidine-containing phosphotransfer) domain-containing protein
MDATGQSGEFASLCAEYLENRRRELPALFDALRCSNFTALAKAAHNLKGTGAPYGFAELTELGRALESAAQAGDRQAAAGRLSQIESFLAQVPSHKES